MILYFAINVNYFEEEGCLNTSGNEGDKSRNKFFYSSAINTVCKCGKRMPIQAVRCVKPLVMRCFELNLSIKDIQLLGGISYASSKSLIKKIKTSRKIKPYQWLSLKDFCNYMNVDYSDAFELLKNNYKTVSKIKLWVPG